MILIYLLDRLSTAIKGDYSIESMVFGTKHLRKLSCNWRKNKEKAEKFEAKYYQTHSPKFFQKWKHYEGKKLEFGERYNQQLKAEEGIEVKTNDGIMIEHPEYGKHF